MSNISEHTSYNEDFYAWAMENAALLRQRNFKELDLDNIAEELEEMGRSNKRELANRFIVLLAHLLKCKYQPSHRGISWDNTIAEQRLQIKNLVKESPSLNPKLEEQFNAAYEIAILRAASEMHIETAELPKTCPFTLEQSLNPDFFPD